MNTHQISRKGLIAYALLAMPLAMAALPVYVHVPKFYAGDLGLPLAWVGAILLAARLLDAIQDPFLGFLSDRFSARGLGRRLWILAGAPLLALGFVALFHVPTSAAATTAAWLTSGVVVVYLGFSLVSISYYAIGAELSPDYHERTRVTATRGALGIVGVLIAAAAPGLLSATGNLRSGLTLFSLLFVPLLAVCAFVTVRWSPRTQTQARTTTRTLRSMFTPFANLEFRWLMGVFVTSGVASAIPGTLILFFVQDVLQQPGLSGLFLGLYFVFGAAAMPFWIAASRKLGKKLAWLAGMLLAVIAFVWAYTLAQGDALAFGVVCALSGIAFGAELAIPPSMLADVVDGDSAFAQSRPDGTYFGLWQMIEKLNLAMAAGLALPLLAVLGYEPGTAQEKFAALSLMYALVPCAIKLASAWLLWIAPLDRVRSSQSLLVNQGNTL